MTYCVGMQLDRGLVFMADTRTNSGVDNLANFSKIRTWCEPGERLITILAAGNLATTQATMALLDERTALPEDRSPTLLEASTMFQVARLVGTTLREVIDEQTGGGQQAENTFDATLILGGQIAGMEPKLFLVYPEGNFIEAGTDTPFFQIGETKYGRPILVRSYDPAMSFEDAVKLLMVSFDSTLKSNLSVGLPLDLEVYETDTFVPGPHRRIESTDPYFEAISSGWRDALRHVLAQLPDFSFDESDEPHR